MIIGFTGHRKLNNLEQVQIELEQLLSELKPEKCISGIAIGFDTLAAEICIKLNIPFIAAVPFYGQEKVWPDFAKERYNKLLKWANEVKYVCSPGYAAWKMQKRNEWIVNNCELLIAAWDGKESGGTYNCIKYAKDVGREIKYLNVV